MTIYRSTSSDAIDVVQLSPGGRQGRQQGGDTYTLEIAFPAVKYVVQSHIDAIKTNTNGNGLIFA